MRAIRDYLRRDVGEILIDNPVIFERAKSHIELVRPDFLNRVKLYRVMSPCSTTSRSSQIESAFQRSASALGGSIVIDPTEAPDLHRYQLLPRHQGRRYRRPPCQTNLEAADEIARQLRLRDLGGLIVIDFIDMTPVRHQRGWKTVCVKPCTRTAPASSWAGSPASVCWRCLASACAPPSTSPAAISAPVARARGHP